MAEQDDKSQYDDDSASLMRTLIETVSSESTTESIPSDPAEIVDSLSEDVLQNVFKNYVDLQVHEQSISSIDTYEEEITPIVLQYEDDSQALYDAKCHAHHQYDLFKLAEFIPNFDIDDKIYDAITFRECLIINKLEGGSDKEGTMAFTTNPVGGICIDIQKAEGKQPQVRLLEEYEEKLLKLLDAEGVNIHMTTEANTPQTSEDSLSVQNEYGYSKFVVHTSSHLDVDGSNGGSSITSWVDRNCHTIEELRKEFIVEEGNEQNINEKSLYTAMKKNYYYVKHTAFANSVDDRKLYSMKKMQGYVSENANFVLMRYLAIRRYFGNFELSCCYINGDMCRNIYECFGPESDMFNNRRIDCCRIKRIIIEECGLVHKSLTVLTLHGLILKHEWDDCDYVFTINPKQVIKDSKPSCLDDLNLDACWLEDLQILSSYLDMKDKALLEVKTYDVDHPELRILMADYVNQILLLRPSDIKNFTYKFFGSFVSARIPRNDYLE